MAKLSDIEGIGEVYTQKLQNAGVASVEGLLEGGCQPKGRQELADKAGIDVKLILGWVNRADLSRIKGISTQYADLLECAGVDTVPELAQRKPENLYEKMASVNSEKNLVRQMPSALQVADWVAQAKQLPRAVHY